MKTDESLNLDTELKLKKLYCVYRKVCIYVLRVLSDCRIIGLDE